MTKRIAVLQSNYIPWKGYFDLIDIVDEFIIYDEVQYTKNDWRNRNRIKTPQGAAWLTIPIAFSGKFGQRIDETRTSNTVWAHKHWKSLRQNYSKAPHFKEFAPALDETFATLGDEPFLSKINRRMIDLICAWLEITTPIVSSDHYQAKGDRMERLLGLCRKAGATHYLSGPAARSYIDPEDFSRAGIELEFMNYEGYPEYDQLYPPFEHSVTALDLLFHTGKEARRHLKGKLD